MAPDPLDSCGLLFGPDKLPLADVSARIAATSKGQRFPEFGIGLGDSGGFKLWVLPGLSTIEIRKNDDPVAVVKPAEFGWKSGEWMRLRLRTVPAGEGKYRVEGKVWTGATEPAAWAVSYETKEAPPAGLRVDLGQSLLRDPRPV